jgi:hypothetical protein
MCLTQSKSNSSFLTLEETQQIEERKKTLMTNAVKNFKKYSFLSCFFKN